MRETDRRFFWLKRKVIAFFLIAAVGLAAMLAVIGVERGIFIPKYRIYFTIARGTGLFEGMPVKLSGFKIGKIESLELTDDAKVKATLAINKKYHKWIRQNSTAVVSKEGLLGESIIEITLGSMDKPIIEDKTEIQFYRTRGLEDIAEDMLPVLVKIKEIVTYINDPDGDFKQTMSHIQVLTKNLRVTEDNINQLVQAAHTRISLLQTHSTKTLENINTLSGDIGTTVRQVNGRLPGIMDKLDRTLDNIEQASRAFNATTDTTLPAMLSKGDNLLDDTQQVMGSLKQTWPIRSYIEESNERLLRSDSHE